MKVNRSRIEKWFSIVCGQFFSCVLLDCYWNVSCFLRWFLKSQNSQTKHKKIEMKERNCLKTRANFFISMRWEIDWKIRCRNLKVHIYQVIKKNSVKSWKLFLSKSWKLFLSILKTFSVKSWKLFLSYLENFSCQPWKVFLSNLENFSWQILKTFLISFWQNFLENLKSFYLHTKKSPTYYGVSSSTLIFLNFSNVLFFHHLNSPHQNFVTPLTRSNQFLSNLHDIINEPMTNFMYDRSYFRKLYWKLHIEAVIVRDFLFFPFFCCLPLLDFKAKLDSQNFCVQNIEKKDCKNLLQNLAKVKKKRHNEQGGERERNQKNRL